MGVCARLVFMPRPPLIGVTTSATADVDVEISPRAHLNRAYLLAVQQAGGVPVLLPPFLDERAREGLWQRLDGLVLSGGGDLDPARFGEPADARVAEVSKARDRLELELTERAVGQGLPLLAICRGIQVLNVALGGSLHQHIPDAYPASAIDHAQKASRQRPTHDVKVLVEGSRLGAVLGVPELKVNSFHHQSLKRLGRGLRESAWAPDGVIEGVDMPDAPGMVLAVQWHPEDLVDHDPTARKLFSALVAAATG
jgi:putative glutamine amidotransferase